MVGSKCKNDQGLSKEPSFSGDSTVRINIQVQQECFASNVSHSGKGNLGEIKAFHNCCLIKQCGKARVLYITRLAKSLKNWEKN